MEIKFEDTVLKKSNNKYNITISSGGINAIVDDYDNIDFLKTLYELKKFEGRIVVDKISINKYSKKSEINKIKDKISIASGSEKSGLFNINILEDLKYRCSDINLQELKEYINKYELDEEILNKSYAEISNGEAKKISLISTLISNKPILIFENPTEYLDVKSRETFLKELKRIKREEKIIIIITNDTDFVIKSSDIVIFLRDNKIYLYNNKYEAFQKKELMIKGKIKTAEIIEFVNSVYKLKKVSLDNRDDINDTIKDVYRNVK